MYIELLDYMGDDLRVANVARVSFNNWKEEYDEKDAKLIDYLATHDHSSPFRHTAISIRCKAPIFMARQLGKHQVGMSWNEVSRRYVDVVPEVFRPENWRGKSDDKKQGSSEVVIDKIVYGETPDGEEMSMTPEEIYEGHVKSCIDIYKAFIANDVAPEMARMILPQSMATEWVWTGSLPAFFHVWKLRQAEGAQKEVREFATELEELLQPLFPKCWEALKNG